MHYLFGIGWSRSYWRGIFPDLTLGRQRVCHAVLLVALFAVDSARLSAGLAGGRVESGLPIFENPQVESEFVVGQVTGFARGEGGVIFVASRHLAVFDGAQWRRIEVEGSSRIFALAASADGRRIWVGANRTIGYVQRNPQGEWKFVSLKERLPGPGPHVTGPVRQVIPTPHGAFFVSQTRVYRWDGEHFTAWSLPPSAWRLIGFGAGEQVLIYQMGVGLLRMDDTGPRLWLTEQSMPAAPPMISMIASNDGTYIAVFDQGVFHLVDGQWHRLDGISDLLKEKRASRAAALPDGTLAIGTTYSGLILANADGTVREVIDSHRGLADDFVLGIWPDSTDQLWIGLSSGLVRVAGFNHASIFDQRSQLFAQGGIVKVLSYDGRPNVITAANDYSLVPSSETVPAHFARTDFVWRTLRDGAALDGDLWLVDADGLWRLPKNRGSRLQVAKANIFLLLTPRAIPGGLLYFESNACKAWLPNAGLSNPIDLKQTLESEPVSVLEDSNGAVWLSTANGHIRKFTWDATARALTLVADFGPGHGLPDNVTRPVLTVLSGAVLAFTDQAILVWDPATNSFLPAPGLSGLIGTAGSTTGETGYWVVHSKKLPSEGSQALIKVTAPDGLGKPFNYKPMLAPGFDHVRKVTSVNITNDNSGAVLWLGLVDGVVRLEIPFLREANPPPGLMWRRVEADSDTIVTLTVASSATFRAGVKRIEFSYAPGVAAGAEGLFYETRLENVESEWSAPRRVGKRTFTDLEPGRYIFAARTVDRFGQAGPASRYIFVIESPWNQRAWFPFVWLLPALLVLWGLHRLRLAQQAARMKLHMELQIAERKRIARELHDTLLQGFIGIGLKLDAIATNLPDSLASVRIQLRNILDQSDVYLADARRSVVELRSTTLESSEDFAHALSVASSRLTDGTGIELIYSVEGERRELAPHIESNLLRIGEEAVNNAVKHARPGKVEVNLRFAAKEVSLCVRDDGRGFEPQGAEATKVGHFGLVGIKERVKSISGRLALNSQLGQGTELIVTVPTA